MSERRDPATILAGVRSRVGDDGVAPAIHVSDTYRWADPETKPAYDYSRTVNPNRDLLIDALAELEGAAGGVATASGQSAALCVLLRLPVGARVVAPHDCYGGTWRLLDRLAAQGKLRVDFIDQHDPDALDRAFAEPLDLLWLETPSNPLLRIVDLAALSARARAAGALSVADNTLATPLGQQPLKLGCDLVVHSTTKALNGHADLFGGAVLAADAGLVEDLAWWSNAGGLNASAGDSAQLLRGLRTLPLRIRQQQDSAAELAAWLEQQEAVERVIYPGLASHPDQALAARQQSGPGFLFSAELRGDQAAARFTGALRTFTLASSLGSFASLVCQPSTMTHRGMTPEAQRAAGIRPDLLRFSIGLEATADLRSDLQRGLDALR